MPTFQISLRLTKTQASLICLGLDYIVTAHASRIAGKRVQRSYPFSLYPPPPNFDRGTYDRTMMEIVTSLWEHLRTKQMTGGRTQMNAIEIRTAIFAIRVTMGMWRLQRHGHRSLTAEAKVRLQVDRQSMQKRRTNARRAIRSLERHLKRANRILRSQMPIDEYRSIMQLWQRHLRWMRLHLAYFKPLPPVIKGRKKGQQAALDVLMEMAAKGLHNEGYEPPNDVELRRLMRLYARSARRGREGSHTIPEMLRYPNFLHNRYLALFVQERVRLRRLQ